MQSKHFIREKRDGRADRKSGVEGRRGDDGPSGAKVRDMSVRLAESFAVCGRLFILRGTDAPELSQRPSVLGDPGRTY